MPLLEDGTAVESRKTEIFFAEYVANNEWHEVVLDEDTLKMANGSSLWFADDGDATK